MRGTLGTGTGVAPRTTDTGIGTGRGTGRETGTGTESETGTGTGETEDAEVAAETVRVGEKNTVVVSVENGAEAGRNLGKDQNQDLKRRTILLLILHHQIKMIRPEWRQIRMMKISRKKKVSIKRKKQG